MAQVQLDPKRWYQVTIIHPRGGDDYMGAMSGATALWYQRVGKLIAAIPIQTLQASKEA